MLGWLTYLSVVEASELQLAYWNDVADLRTDPRTRESKRPTRSSLKLHDNCLIRVARYHPSTPHYVDARGVRRFYLASELPAKAGTETSICRAVSKCGVGLPIA